MQAGFLTNEYQGTTHEFTCNSTIFWVNFDNGVCYSHIQVNSKLRENTEKLIKMSSRQMFYYNDNVKLTARVKLIYKLKINKYLFLLMYLK